MNTETTTVTLICDFCELVAEYSVFVDAGARFPLATRYNACEDHEHTAFTNLEEMGAQYASIQSKCLWA